MTCLINYNQILCYLWTIPHFFNYTQSGIDLDTGLIKISQSAFYQKMNFDHVPTE